jgi:molybdate-binding protein/DNA-binding XRE family transcriptional regulator
VTEPTYECHILALRERLHISQVELARRAGLTRQAVNMIERGFSVPSITSAMRLAEALECPLTELFKKPEPDEFVPVTLSSAAREFPQNRVRLAEVGGRWIAIPFLSPDAAEFGEADGRLISKEGQRGTVRLLGSPDFYRNNLLVAGCDPALGILRDLWKRHQDEGAFRWQNLSSSEAVHALRKGEAHIAGVHFHDAESQRRAIARLPMDVIVVRFAKWEQGWMVPKGNPFKFHSVADLPGHKIKLFNRNEGSGSRLMLDALLKEARIAPDKIRGYDTAAQTHFACARAIRDGSANVAIGLRAVSESCGLDFVPVQEVGFNLIIPQPLLDFPPVARLLDLLQAARFQRQLKDLPGYETAETGKVLTPV